MKLLILTEGPLVPSTRFRILPLAPLLEAQGIHCTIRHCFPTKYLVAQKRLIRPIVDSTIALARVPQIWDAGRFDAVLMQRDLVRWPWFFPESLLLCRQPRLLLDIDDAQWLFASESKIKRIAERSSAVFCGNENLRGFFSPIPTLLVPTCVDTSSYAVKQVSDSPQTVIGWVGSEFNFPFFEEIRVPLERLLRNPNLTLEIVSDGKEVPSLAGLPVTYRRWRSDAEFDALLRFDIGIMPLPDNELTRHKCGLKLIQYMAAGLPSVASPVGANRDIVCDGETGFLATTAAEWERAVLALAESSELRQRMGASARARAEARYDVHGAAQIIGGALRDHFKARV